MPVALAARELERHAPKPNLVVAIHPIDAADIAVAVKTSFMARYLARNAALPSSSDGACSPDP
jgi:hypothetical protein